MGDVVLGPVRRRIGAAGDWCARFRQAARQVGMWAYHRGAAFNHEHRLFARRHATVAGAYRSYEPVTTHGSDPLLDALAGAAGPGDTIYDIGAYAGDYALPLAANDPDRTVVAVEPNPVSRRHLRANRERTAPEGTLRVCPTGVGAERGRRPFYCSSFPKLSSFDVTDATRWGARVTRVEPVPVRPLDTLVERFPAPDHVKIDVEGLAPAVLSGATETLDCHRPTLFVEPHDRPGADRQEAVRARCGEHGYSVTERDGALVCRPE